MATGPLRATGPLTLPGGSPGLLANRAFLLLWLGQATSGVGDRVHQIAVMWWSLKLHGQLSDAGWVMVATTLPLVLFAPLGGVLADRHDRRAVMLVCDIARAIITAVLAILALGHVLTLPVLLGGTALLAGFTAVFMPAAMALVPSLVAEKDLMRAGSLQELTIQLATIVGPSIGGVLVAAVGSPWAFGVNAVSFVISAGALLLMGASLKAPERALAAVSGLGGQTPGSQAGSLAGTQSGTPPESLPGTQAGARSWRQDMLDGLMVARELPTIGVLLLAFGLTNFFSAPLLLFLPRYAELFAVGPRGLGFLEAALAVGTLGAALLLLSRQQALAAPGFLPPASLAVIGLVMVGLGQFGTFPAFLAGMGAIGLALGAMNVTVVAYFQQTVPPERLGRFMGLLTAVVFAAPSVGFGLMGTLASTAHPGPYVTAMGGGVMVVAAGLGLALLRLRR